MAKMFEFNKYGHKDPFDISFCNLDPNGLMMRLMDNYFQKHPLIEYYINTTSDSYLNHFDCNKLCYICPQAVEPLDTYDNDTIYILPGVCHHRMDLPLSMMRVRHEGIPMKRIPVEEYGTLKGNYHLELSNTLEIMSYFRDHKDMRKALEIYLPQTVWKTGEDLEHEDEDVIRRLLNISRGIPPSLAASTHSCPKLNSRTIASKLFARIAAVRALVALRLGSAVAGNDWRTLRINASLLSSGCMLGYSCDQLPELMDRDVRHIPQIMYKNPFAYLCSQWMEWLKWMVWMEWMVWAEG
ncbi:unnamed protein product [Oppiella nova]|uniref:SAM-dependent MTase TRM10-type domain-containing protein n=1 Tax=Oppiella nova TaxID=334625 RepID=A0A7R9LQZ2_9ACAR|nr:unnamed protein product [Oppiella nova]CAG2165747.1 unnamed protein product [Oppiella nova]